MRTFFVYILASQRNGTLYIGVTSRLSARIQEHKEKMNRGFTQKYNVNMLVYCESYEMITEAIEREKQLKKWRRKWKLELIESINPEWKDLASGGYVEYPLID